MPALGQDVASVSVEYRLSQRRACKLIDVERSSYRYEPRPDRNAALRGELLKLTRQKPSYSHRKRLCGIARPKLADGPEPGLSGGLMVDHLATGRMVRILSVVDAHTRASAWRLKPTSAWARGL